MEKYEIRSVQIVDRETLNSRWHSKMQIVETDKGTFIDNIPNKQFGYFSTAKAGYDWSSLIGQTVSNIKIFYSRGFSWINYQ